MSLSDYMITIALIELCVILFLIFIVWTSRKKNNSNPGKKYIIEQTIPIADIKGKVDMIAKLGFGVEATQIDFTKKQSQWINKNCPFKLNDSVEIIIKGVKKIESPVPGKPIPRPYIPSPPYSPTPKSSETDELEKDVELFKKIEGVD